MQASELHSVGSASLAIFAQRRHGAREILHAKIALEACQRSSQEVARCCPNAGAKYVHTRSVRPETLFGTLPVRPFQCRGCGAMFRPDDAALGVPEAGAFTDDVRDLYAPVAAALPPRVANDLCHRGTGVALRSRGAHGSLESTAEPHRVWPVEPEREEAEAVAEAVGLGDGGAQLRLEIARDGVMAHIDGRWPEAQVGPIVGRRRAGQAAEPTLGAILARRSVAVLGSPEDLAIGLQQVLRAAGWEGLPRGEIVGDGAPWVWKVAEAYFPGVRQTLDDAHLSEPLEAFAQLLDPHHPAGTKAWVDEKRGALLTDRLGKVLGALQRMRPWEKALRAALTQLLGDVARQQTRLRYQEPWPQGRAVGSGAVEGACNHVMQRRFKRAAMRWKPPGFLKVWAWRLAHRHGTFQAFWASRGLVT